MNVGKRRNRIRYGRLLAFLAAAALVVSCDAFFPQEPETYRATELPEDVTELFEVHGGDPESGTVWIYEQGGPLHELMGDYESFRAYPGHREIHFVQPHQTLTLNAELAARAEEYTLAELQAEVDVSVEILHRTIQHFRSEGKRVVVIGHSYGAILITRYLWQKPPESADRYLIMAGRLDMPEEVVDGFMNGRVYYFPDGVTPVDSGIRETTDRGLMEMRMAAATGHERYTERLADRDLGRVIYVYGTEDISVGRLTEEEVSLLESRGAKVIEAEGGDHGSMFEDEEVVREITDALQQPTAAVR
ncbi:MAG: alpha/beta hydrolase [Candidatus Dadabacteria bacterium]|nr:alpha/beta hydrolase [Candidatus Dadabacteria bacterium]